MLVVDDDDGFRAFVADALRQAAFAVHEAGSGEAALSAARRVRPDLVVLDVRLPGLSGYEVLHELREELGEELPIVFVSGERAESFDRAAGILLGGDDYLAKPLAIDELLARARHLITRRRSAPRERLGLTGRERQILALLADGLSPAQVADKLVISQSTVGTHVEHIYTKLGASSRAQAVGVAYRRGLLEVPSR